MLASLYCIGNAHDRKDWLKNERKGIESSLDSSRKIRLLADSTYILVSTILSRCELSLLISGMLGRLAFCAFSTV